MDRDNVDAISEAITEYFGKFQNTIEQYAVNQLTLYTDNPSEWKEKQLKHKGDFKKAVNKLVKQFKQKLNRPIEVAFREIFKDAKEDVEDTIDEELKKPKIKKKIEKFKIAVFVNVDNVAKSSLLGFTRIVNDAGEVILRKKITSGDRLFEVINNAMDKGIKDMFVYYSDGKKVRFKSYMEMNVRTTMQQEALQYQYESAKSNGVIFYLCSRHSDCANDHADFQGRIYYDADWQNITAKENHDAVKSFISKNKLMSIQQVRDSKPYLTTRPNCRHTFKPITIGQALGNNVNHLLKEFQMDRGSADSRKYKELQKQRKYERDVRSAKEQRDNTIIELRNAKDDDTKKMLEKRLKREKSIVTKAQRKVNQLVKSNPYLERDYRRENYKAIVQDVGVKYNKDKK